MGILTQMLRKAIELVGLIAGKAKFSDVFMRVLSWVPDLVNQVRGIGGMSTKEKIDEALRSMDDLTGVDDGAIDVLHDLPADKEEALFDHLTEVIRILSYNRIELDGYYIPESATLSTSPAADQAGGNGGQ